MNARIRKGLAALTLLAWLAGGSACAAAQEARPERLRSFGTTRSCRGVSASTQWLSQARLGGISLNLRVTTKAGAEVTFMERLTASKDEVGMALEILTSIWEDGTTLQVDQRALDQLTRLGVTRVVMADPGLNVRQRYDVPELSDVCALLGLKKNEQLCVAGDDAPLAVVGEDGVRRLITR